MRWRTVRGVITVTLVLGIGLWGGTALEHHRAAPLAIANESAARQSVGIRVYPIGRTDRYGPRLLVVLSNTSRDVIYLERELRAVEPRWYHPLRAVVVDRATGKKAWMDALYSVELPPWREDRFVAVGPGHCYGVMVDLRDEFQTESGHQYRVRFGYRTSAPPKVGRIRPWKGLAVSDWIVVSVP